LATLQKSESSEQEQLMFLWAEPRVNLSALQASEAAWMMRAVTWRLSLWRWLSDCDVNGWYGRTCPVSCRVTKDGILEPSSGGWQNAGMGGPIESWTLNTSEFHSAAVACSLSDILETGDVQPQYYLSALVCSGILRRAKKKGEKLPVQLEASLEAIAAAALKKI